MTRNRNVHLTTYKSYRTNKSTILLLTIIKNLSLTDQLKSITPTLILILLNAAFWLGYAVLTILTNDDPASVSSVARLIFTFLALGTSAILVVLYFLLRKPICFGIVMTLSNGKKIKLNNLSFGYEKKLKKPSP